nr:retrovirus-related Pol polyprotein from transposon 17.6 [Tanacetum cinerariifolium]
LHRDLEIQREIYDDETLSNPSDWYDVENPFGARRQKLRGTNRDDPLRNFGMKIEIPEFVGKAHPDEFIDWLSTVEIIFDLRDVLEKLKVKLVAIKLCKSASLWWDHVKNQRVKDGKSKVETWAKMKKLLRAKFLLVKHRQEAFIEYQNFSQRAPSSVEDFIAEFDRLRMRCDVDEEEEQIIAWFLGAFQPHIVDVVHLQQYLTYEDVCRLALKVEKQQKNWADVGIETGDDTSWVRNNIFRTKCTTKGKFCTVIIDGGSCDNMVAIRLTKLNPQLIMLALVITQANPVVPLIPDLVQPLLSQFQDVFPDDIPTGLPLIRDIQHCIDFIPGSTIPNKPAYRMHPKEFEELHEQVTELLEKGLIRESMSPCAIPALLVPKHGGTFRMCIDNRAVNKITVKYRFPIPRFDDLIDQLHRARIFSKIDLRSGYHQIHMRLENEWKTAFKIRDGLYEWMGGQFTWTKEADKAFSELKQRITQAPVLALPNFEEVFHVECDASGLGIGGILSQNQRPIAFFSEKFNEARCKYSTYDKEFYAIVRSLDYWRHYLLSAVFVLFFDHEALKYINGQHKLSSRHAKWVEFLQAYSFTIRHKAGSAKVVADALSRRHVLTSSLQIQVVYKEGDLVWIHVRKERFPTGRYGKLQARADGPFWVLKRINDNAYKIELPGHYNVSATFNVTDLSPYEGDSDDGLQSGVSLFQDGEDDAGASHASNF